jgi:organic hydroperoxide reductase OsmC/OhrA
MEAIYTGTATASGDGRSGHVESDDGQLALDVRIPKEMGGPGGATNPEHLFAGGYAACLHSALNFVGTTEKADLAGSEVSVTVAIGPLATGASDWPSSSTCTRPASKTRSPGPWPRRRTRYAPTPTPPGATSMSS